MIRTPRRHWQPKLRWLPRIPRQTPPPIDAPLIDITYAHDGRALVRRMARDGRHWLLPGSIASAFVSLVNIGVPMALGRAIDDGVVAADAAALTGWLALVGLSYAVRAVAQTVRMQTNVGAGVAEHDLRVQALTRITAPEGIGGRSRLPGDLLAVVVTDVRGGVASLHRADVYPRQCRHPARRPHLDDPHQRLVDAGNGVHCAATHPAVGEGGRPG